RRRGIIAADGIIKLISDVALGGAGRDRNRADSKRKKTPFQHSHTTPPMQIVLLVSNRVFQLGFATMIEYTPGRRADNRAPEGSSYVVTLAPRGNNESTKSGVRAVFHRRDIRSNADRRDFGYCCRFGWAGRARREGRCHT